MRPTSWPLVGFLVRQKAPITRGVPRKPRFPYTVGQSVASDEWKEGRNSRAGRELAEQSFCPSGGWSQRLRESTGVSLVGV